MSVFCFANIFTRQKLTINLSYIGNFYIYIYIYIYINASTCIIIKDVNEMDKVWVVVPSYPTCLINIHPNLYPYPLGIRYAGTHIIF